MEQEQTDKVKQTMKDIIDNREEILRAFVAKHGCEPEDIIQVMQKTGDGGIKFCVRMKTKEESGLGSLDHFLRTQIENCAAEIRQAAFRNDTRRGALLSVRMGAFKEMRDEMRKRASH